MKKSQIKKEMMRKNFLKKVKETKREVYGFEISVKYGKRCVREYNKSSKKTIRDINILRETLKTQIDKHADELIEITKTRKNKDIEYINNKIKQLEKKILIKKVLLTRWIAKLKSNNDTIRLTGFNTTPLHRRDYLTSPPPPLVLVNDDSDSGSVIQNLFGKLENMKKKPNTNEVKKGINKNSYIEQNKNHGKINTSNTTYENNMRRIITRSLSVAGVNNTGNILSEGHGCSTDSQVIHTARFNQENPGLQNNMHIVNNESISGTVTPNIFEKLEVKSRSGIEQNEKYGKINISNTTNENNMKRMITRSLSVAGVNNTGNILSEGPGCSTDSQVIHTARFNQENPGLQNNMHIVNNESKSGTVTPNIFENLGDRNQKSNTKEIDVEQNENHSKIIPSNENKSGRMITRSLSIPGVKNIENISSEEPWCSRDPEVMCTSCVNQEKINKYMYTDEQEYTHRASTSWSAMKEEERIPPSRTTKENDTKTTPSSSNMQTMIPSNRSTSRRHNSHGTKKYSSIDMYYSSRSSHRMTDSKRTSSSSITGKHDSKWEPTLSSHKQAPSSRSTSGKLNNRSTYMYSSTRSGHRFWSTSRNRSSRYTNRYGSTEKYPSTRSAHRENDAKRSPSSSISKKHYETGKPTLSSHKKVPLTWSTSRNRNSRYTNRRGSTDKYASTSFKSAHRQNDAERSPSSSISGKRYGLGKPTWFSHKEVPWIRSTSRNRNSRYTNRRGSTDKYSSTSFKSSHRQNDAKRSPSSSISEKRYGSGKPTLSSHEEVPLIRSTSRNRISPDTKRRTCTDINTSSPSKHRRNEAKRSPSSPITEKRYGKGKWTLSSHKEVSSTLSTSRNRISCDTKKPSSTDKYSSISSAHRQNDVKRSPSSSITEKRDDTWKPTLLGHKQVISIRSTKGNSLDTKTHDSTVMDSSTRSAQEQNGANQSSSTQKCDDTEKLILSSHKDGLSTWSISRDENSSDTQNHRSTDIDSSIRSAQRQNDANETPSTQTCDATGKLILSSHKDGLSTWSISRDENSSDTQNHRSTDIDSSIRSAQRQNDANQTPSTQTCDATGKQSHDQVNIDNSIYDKSTNKISEMHINKNHPWKGIKLNISKHLENVTLSTKYDLPKWCLKRSSPSELQHSSELIPKKKRKTQAVVDMKEVCENITKLKSWLYDKQKLIKKNYQLRNRYCGEPVENKAAILYMLSNIELNISLPHTERYLTGKKSVFTTTNDKMVEIREKYLHHYRWVFIPSHKRARKANWNDIKRNAESDETTIYIIVVRCSVFKEYIDELGDVFPIIQLRDDGGIGFSREWIMKIAYSQSIEYIWMMDDNVSWFKEYIPDQTEEKGIEKDPGGTRKENLVNPQDCFQLMEHVFKTFKNKNLVAMSPRRQGPYLNMTNEFAYKPTQCVMLLDVNKIKTGHNIQFDQNLQYFEDIIFSAECHEKGLKTCIWNRFIFFKKPYNSVCKPS